MSPVVFWSVAFFFPIRFGFAQMDHSIEDGTAQSTFDLLVGLGTRLELVADELLIADASGEPIAVWGQPSISTASRASGGALPQMTCWLSCRQPSTSGSTWASRLCSTADVPAPPTRSEPIARRLPTLPMARPYALDGEPSPAWESRPIRVTALTLPR